MWKDVEKPGFKRQGQDACRHINRKLQFAGKNDEVRFRGRNWN
jgi:hypothetical protein